MTKQRLLPAALSLVSSVTVLVLAVLSIEGSGSAIYLLCLQVVAAFGSAVVNACLSHRYAVGLSVVLGIASMIVVSLADEISVQVAAGVATAAGLLLGSWLGTHYGREIRARPAPAARALVLVGAFIMMGSQFIGISVAVVCAFVLVAALYVAVSVWVLFGVSGTRE